MLRTDAACVALWCRRCGASVSPVWRPCGDVRQFAVDRPARTMLSYLRIHSKHTMTTPDLISDALAQIKTRHCSALIRANFISIEKALREGKSYADIHNALNALGYPVGTLKYFKEAYLRERKKRKTSTTPPPTVRGPVKTESADTTEPKKPYNYYEAKREGLEKMYPTRKS